LKLETLVKLGRKAKMMERPTNRLSPVMEPRQAEIKKTNSSSSNRRRNMMKLRLRVKEELPENKQNLKSYGNQQYQILKKYRFLKKRNNQRKHRLSQQRRNRLLKIETKQQQQKKQMLRLRHNCKQRFLRIT